MILSVYGITNTRTFEDHVRRYNERRHSPQDQIQEIVERLSEEKVKLVLSLCRRIAEGNAIILV